MTSSATVAALRKRHYALEALPDTIVVPALGACRPEAVVRTIEDASLDDIAFALRGIEAEFNAVGDRLHALRKLYLLARDAGALGADRAVNAVAATEGVD
jgi:hypothetical protein